ncbi:hypothetical protein [Leisingera methylohalidivorans]|uniref:hypothetical protein n=1 Tax=Leisingera methylohalidivorans TaxID=133924 RepID=UPI0012EC6E6B|nr:hypothetical protein [Leisingera methylohalidivorans]
MWFEPLAEAGTLLAGCAAMLGAAMPVLKRSEEFSKGAFSGLVRCAVLAKDNGGRK